MHLAVVNVVNVNLVKECVLHWSAAPKVIQMLSLLSVSSIAERSLRYGFFLKICRVNSISGFSVIGCKII